MQPPPQVAHALRPLQVVHHPRSVAGHLVHARAPEAVDVEHRVGRRLHVLHVLLLQRLGLGLGLGLGLRLGLGLGLGSRLGLGLG